MGRRTQRGRRLERAVLVVMFALGLASLVLLAPAGPRWLEWLGQAGLTALVGLALWWIVSGFSGYEHVAGFRIIRREPSDRRRMKWSWLWFPGAVGIAGLVVLEVGHKSVPVVLAVAMCGATVLVALVSRYFSVFAAVSIVGVAIGVAALIVVQSVATGFQHEFERRVLGVYAHINVTRPTGISEYRRFEAYLKTLPGVVGVSPFAYHGMILAPLHVDEKGGEMRQAGVTVKGIEPETAGSVIDLEQHLDRAMDPAVTLEELVTDVVLRPVADRDDEALPAVVGGYPDPRGEGWYDRALEEWKKAPGERKVRSRAPIWEQDEWPDETAFRERDPLDSARLPTIFIGTTLAQRLAVEVGDVLVMVDPGSSFDHSEVPEIRHYRIAGLFTAGFQEYDAQLAYLHIRELQRFKYRGRDVVSGLDLRLDDAYDAPRIQALLEASLGAEYTILEWQQLNANLFSSIRQQKSMLTIILSLVSAVAGFNVLAALWTMVVRRGPEISIMMTMGAMESGVARMFQFAGMSIGVTGCVAGLGFGLLQCRLVELYGYTLDPEVYFIDRLPVEYDLLQMGIVLGVTLVICFIATIPPALRAAKLRPVEGLRYD